MKITIFSKADLNTLTKEQASNKANQGEIFEIKSRKEFLDAVCEFTWSSGIFKDDYRKIDNFIEANFIAFDIDEGLSLKEAIERIKLIGLKCVIGTSINHQKPKKGLVADRYRVIFPLSQPISNKDDYKATWMSIAGEEEGMLFGSDTSCKDVSRYFFPCAKATFIEGSRKLDPVKYVAKPWKKIKKNIVPKGVKGEISSRTKDFIENGTITGNSRHHELYLAVMDLKAQNYTREEVISLVEPIMAVVKPEENVEYQVNYIYDKHDFQFDFRRKK